MTSVAYSLKAYLCFFKCSFGWILQEPILICQPASRRTYTVALSLFLLVARLAWLRNSWDLAQVRLLLVLMVVCIWQSAWLFVVDTRLRFTFFINAQLICLSSFSVMLVFEEFKFLLFCPPWCFSLSWVCWKLVTATAHPICGPSFFGIIFGECCFVFVFEYYFLVSLLISETITLSIYPF